MSMYDAATKSLDAAQRDVRFQDMTVEQKMEVAKVEALLSISEQLSLIHHQGVNPKFDPS